MYLVINKVFCFVGKKDGIKYLKIDKGNKKVEDSIISIWNKIFSGIKYNIKKINHKCLLIECKGFPDCKTLSDFKVNFEDDFDKIKFVSNGNLSVGKLIYFPMITVMIRCVLKQGDPFYPQVYLDDALYQL